jgi:hypothetical protein
LHGRQTVSRKKHLKNRVSDFSSLLSRPVKSPSQPVSRKKNSLAAYGHSILRLVNRRKINEPPAFLPADTRSCIKYRHDTLKKSCFTAIFYKNKIVDRTIPRGGGP